MTLAKVNFLFIFLTMAFQQILVSAGSTSFSRPFWKLIIWTVSKIKEKKVGHFGIKLLGVVTRVFPKAAQWIVKVKKSRWKLKSLPPTKQKLGNNWPKAPKKPTLSKTCLWTTKKFGHVSRFYSWKSLTKPLWRLHGRSRCQFATEWSQSCGGALNMLLK